MSTRSTDKPRGGSQVCAALGRDGALTAAHLGRCLGAASAALEDYAMDKRGGCLARSLAVVCTIRTDASTRGAVWKSQSPELGMDA
jgi:hypothetical protein